MFKLLQEAPFKPVIIQIIILYQKMELKTKQNKKITK